MQPEDFLAKKPGEFFIIQNKQGFLEGGPRHFMRPLDKGIDVNPTYIKWSFTPFNGGHTIQCKVNGHFLSGGKKHMWRRSTGTHPRPDYITWFFVPFQGGFLLENKATGDYLTAGPAGVRHMGPKPEGINSDAEPVMWVPWTSSWHIYRHL
jgi:hypothetical protein